MMHGGNFHNHAEAEVVAVCDMDPELREKAEAEFVMESLSDENGRLAALKLQRIFDNETVSKRNAQARAHRNWWMQAI